MGLSLECFLSLLLLSVSLTSQAAPDGAHAFTSSGAEGGQQCDIARPRAGVLPFNSKLRLGEPVEFDDGVGINGGLCFPLYAGRRLVTWLDSYHRVGTRIYLRRCIEDAAARERLEAPVNSRSGYVEETFRELLWRKRDFKFAARSFPLWGSFASPSFCRSYVAYWGTAFNGDGTGRVYAIVLDLKTRRVVRRVFLGATRIESDSRAFFPEPKWSPDGGSVRFDNFVGEGESRIERAGIRQAVVSLRR